jgi:hypothetical protein
VNRYRIALALVASVGLASCGLAGAVFDPFGIFEGRYEGFAGDAHLVVTSRGAPHRRLVRIEFRDPTTDEPLGARAVDGSGEGTVRLTDLPEGEFRVAARFDDGMLVLARPVQPTGLEAPDVVRLSADVAAEVVVLR